MFLQILHSYNGDRASKKKLEDCSFCQNGQHFEIRPYSTLKRLSHGPKNLSSKSYKVALDTPKKKIVASDLIGAEIDGGIMYMTPPDGVILRPPLQCGC